MNLSSMFSRALRLWCTRRDWVSKREEMSRMEGPNSSCDLQFTPRRTQSITRSCQTPFLYSPTGTTHHRAG